MHVTDKEKTRDLKGFMIAGSCPMLRNDKSQLLTNLTLSTSGEPKDQVGVAKVLLCRAFVLTIHHTTARGEAIGR